MKLPVLWRLGLLVGCCVVATPVYAQLPPKRTTCTAKGELGANARASVESIEARFSSQDWSGLDAELRELTAELSRIFTCNGNPPSIQGSFVFIWKGAGSVPRHYLIHGTIARRPRTYMPTGAGGPLWHEVIVARNEAEANGITRSWAATAAAPAGVDAAAWLQTLLTAAIPGMAGLFPVAVDSLPRATSAGKLVLRMNQLTTHLVPARLLATLTAEGVAVEKVIQGRASLWEVQIRPLYATSAAAGTLLQDYASAFTGLSCTDPSDCKDEALRRIGKISTASPCHDDPDCVAITASAREWAMSLPSTFNEIRQVSLSAEPPKRWALGLYAGVAAYPGSVSDGRRLRVRAGADGKLLPDPFSRLVTGFVAAWAVRAHEPDYWGVANLGLYAGVVSAPNIGGTIGVQWRIFRQIALAGGPILLAYPTGRIGDVISSASPLKKKWLPAWTSGVTFTLDAR